VTSAAIPGGGECTGKKNRPGPCWKAGRAGFRYLDRAGASDGVELLDLDAAKRKAAFALRARREGPASGRMRAQLLNGVGGCWETDTRRRKG